MSYELLQSVYDSTVQFRTNIWQAYAIQSSIFPDIKDQSGTLSDIKHI